MGLWIYSFYTNDAILYNLTTFCHKKHCFKRLFSVIVPDFTFFY